MLVFTPRNAVILALLQLTVIGLGLLGAGIAHKLDSQHLLLTTGLLVHYGFWLLLVPLVWISVALQLRKSPTASDRLKRAVFIAGFVFFIFMVGLSGDAVFRPLLTHQPCFLTGDAETPPESETTPP